MADNIADIDVYTTPESPVHISGVQFIYNPGERTPYNGVDSTSSTLHAGWLGLKIEPFDGWQWADIISFSGSNGDDRVFVVSRHFQTPLKDGDWLWYPVTPQKVEPFSN
ncbi:hypothetical protein PS682_04501 [Pseudomonas fluorescens]|nr:hypothetical protein PS682_04501 [Pseudomonas fluorescens]